MGLCAEKTAEDLNISRQLQDDYAILSYERAIECIRDNRYAGEITPVNLGKKFKEEVF
jgi:acetyl-CoA C-acetyltransferase